MLQLPPHAPMQNMWLGLTMLTSDSIVKILIQVMVRIMRQMVQ